MDRLSPDALSLLRRFEAAPEHRISVSDMEAQPPCMYWREQLAALQERGFIEAAAFEPSSEQLLHGIPVFKMGTPSAFVLRFEGFDYLQNVPETEDNNPVRQQYGQQKEPNGNKARIYRVLGRIGAILAAIAAIVGIIEFVIGIL